MIQFWGPCLQPSLAYLLICARPDELDREKKFPIRKYRKIKINSKCSVEKTINLRHFCYFDSQTNASVERKRKEKLINANNELELVLQYAMFRCDDCTRTK